MRLRGADFKLKKVLGRQTFQKTALRSSILFASHVLKLSFHYPEQKIKRKGSTRKSAEWPRST